MRWFIEPNAPTLDGKDRYEPGQLYDVLEETGKKFKQYGWGVRVEVDPEQITYDKPKWYQLSKKKKRRVIRVG